jgi:O-methyltransferase
MVEKRSKSENSMPRDVMADEAKIIRKIKPYTMTSIDRAVSLIRAVKYVIENRLEGEFVECGVWRGGSMMAVARTLINLGETSRQLFLYDTFSGMPMPTAKDARFDGSAASDLLAEATDDSRIKAFASLEDVTTNIRSTGYPAENIHLVQGRVEDTIPLKAPERICLLRLDTDWYESTKHELLHLYPRLVTNGILIIDDYGHWRGAKEATDEYFRGCKPAPFLHRIDYTARLIVKMQHEPVLSL